MLYTFLLGIRILDQAPYAALTALQKSEVRKLLFEAAADVGEVLGSFETESPKAKLAEQLKAVPGGSWSAGVSLTVGTYYVFDPVTGRRICIEDYRLDLDGQEFIQTVEVAGQSIKSGYFVQQTAEND